MDTLLLSWIGILLAIIAGCLIYPKKNKTVYLGVTKEIDTTKDITTATPVPMSSATCAHNWDVLDDKLLDMPHEKKHVLVVQCRTCGLLDKTIAITSPAPEIKAPPPVPCYHVWESVVNTTLDAEHEKKIIAILTCKLCGKIDKTVEVTSPAPEIKPPPPVPCHHVWESVVNTTLDAEHEKKIIAILTCKLCGKIDKTVEVTSPPPPPAWTKDQCRHKWDVEKRVLIDSAYEQMLESIKVKSNNYSGTKKIDPSKNLDLDLKKAPQWMFKKTYVSIRSCTVCGEIDKTIASNMGEEVEVPEEQNV